MSNKDYLNDNFSVETFIPEALRNQTVTTLVKNLFDRHLSKDESKSFYGYVGKKQTDPNDLTPFVKHSTEERRINNLHPLIRGEVGTETYVFSFNDVLNKCRQLGIDTDKFYEWGATTSFNFAPPIDLDKFINYKRYRWIAKEPTTIVGNPSLKPEYFVIKRPTTSNPLKQDADYLTSDFSVISNFVLGATYTQVNGTFIANEGVSFYFQSLLIVDSIYNGKYEVYNGTLVRTIDMLTEGDVVDGAIVNIENVGAVLVDPIVSSNTATLLAVYGASGSMSTIPLVTTVISEADAFTQNIPVVNDWVKCNYWVHEDDLANLGLVKEGYPYAIRPIIEFDNNVELLSRQLIDNFRNSQRKLSVCQTPLFTHYHFSGSNAASSGTILTYLEDEDAAVDRYLQRRIAREPSTSDFVFTQSLVEPETGASLFFKRSTYVVNAGQVVQTDTLNSLWSPSPISGTVLVANQKAFTGTDAVIVINSVGLKESTDNIIFTAVTTESVSFESNVLGVYAGPIIRTNVNPASRNLIVEKDGVIESIDVSELSTYIANGWTELMSDIYVGETIEIPNYVTFTYTVPGTSPVVDDTFITKIYTAEVPRYVKYNEDGNLVDLYQGEAYDIQNAKDTNTDPQGAWYTPKQLKQNIMHENRETFAFGDLTGHFRLIMAEQPGIEGSLNGSNNYRKLEPINFGIGGLIKNYDVGYNLLISMLLQDDITPLTIIDFIEDQYAQNVLSISEFMKKSLSSVFTKIGIESISDIDPNNPYVDEIFEQYASYMSARSDLNAFSDSTMPIPKWTLTLPAARITTLYEPTISFDNDFGQDVIVYHDGHLSGLTQEDLDFDQSIALLQVNPKDPTDTSAGFYVDSVTPPMTKEWFKGMAWFNPSSKVLRILNVIGDDDTISSTVGQIGDFWTLDNQLWIFNGTFWEIYYGDPMNAWVVTQPELLIDSLILNIENRIYNALPINNFIYDQPIIVDQASYEDDLIRFSARNGLDPYATDYVQTDAWTWNYALADFSAVDGSLNGLARWNVLYTEYLGTCRPVFEPWKIAGLTTQVDIDTFIATHKTDYQDLANHQLIPLNSGLQNITCHALMTTNIANFAAAPMVVDGYSLAANNYVLVIGQTDKTENGIYQVAGLNTWVNVNAINSSSLGSWSTILNGDKWKSTTWVLHNITPSVEFSYEQYRFWKQTMWTYLISTTGKRMCVNVFNDQMIPPYVNGSNIAAPYALLNVIPSGIADRYVFGDQGPVELAWLKSIDFKTSVVRNAFKTSPIDFLMKTWGDAFVANSLLWQNNKFERTSVIKTPHTDIVLHGEEQPEQIRTIFPLTSLVVNGLSIDVTNSATSYLVELEMIDQFIVDGWRTDPVFSVFVNGAPTTSYIHITSSDGYWLNAEIIDRDGNVSNELETLFGIIPTTFIIAEQGHGFNIGDVIGFMVTHDGVDLNSVNITATTIHKSLGFNQSYTHLMRYSNYDTVNSFNNTFLRKWIVKYGYRFDSIVKSEEVEIKAETFEIPSSLREIHLKVNPHVKEFWIHSLRIQLVRMGQYTTGQYTGTTTSNGNNVTGLTGLIPSNDASDWEFRIENYQARNPFIDIYKYDESGPYQTFMPLANPDFKIWKKYTTVIGTETMPLPTVVMGLQNLLNVIFGYVDKLETDGWMFNRSPTPTIDEEINRTITWQSEIDKLISYIYTGITEGQGHILNPFRTDLWFQSSVGMVSKFEDHKFVDFNSSQVACDIYGNVISTENLNVLRDEDITKIASVIPMFSLHLFVDEYEHVVLFNNYVDETNKFTLIFDPYLGIFVARLLFNGQQHSVKTGRPVLGGYFLNGQTMTKNMMKQFDEIADYYDVTKILKSPELSRNSLALVGFNEKDYFDKLKISPTSQFNFWQAMIKSKGTNQNITAYLNNNRFKTAYLDEYWAYKVAEYGDARTEESPELNVEVSDSENSYTIFKFNGLDNLDPIPSTNGTIDIDQFDSDRWSFANRADQDLINYYLIRDVRGEWTIDTEKFASLTDEQQNELQKLVNKHFYFNANNVMTIEDLATSVRTGDIAYNVQYRDENSDLDDPHNQIITLDLPKAAWTSDMIVVHFYKTTGSTFEFVTSATVKNDNTPMFRWTDVYWPTFTSTFDPTHKTGQEYTLSNLVATETFFNSETATYDNVFSSAILPNIENDARGSLIPAETFVTRINDRLLRIIPGTIGTIDDAFNVTINGEVITKIEVQCYNVDIKKHSGGQLIDYSKNTMVDDVPLWHPELGSVQSAPLRNIDYKTQTNPAKFGYVPNIYRNALYSNLNPWGPEKVGTTWWDMSKCEYTPYYDLKRYPNLQERISRWGKLTDFSEIAVYEWIESTVKPTDYDTRALAEESNFSIDENTRTTGTAALPQFFSQNRIWYSRPIVWSHVSVPIKTFDDVNSGLTYSADTRVILSTDTDGQSWATLDRGSYDDYGIQEGTMLAGWGNYGYIESEWNVPFGQLQFTDKQYWTIGQEVSEEQYAEFYNGTNSVPISTLFNTIKTRSSEMNKIANSNPSFKDQWLVDTVRVEIYDDEKPLALNGQIQFELTGFIWNASYINLLEGLTPASNTPGVSNNLLLSVYEVNLDGNKTLKESINVDTSYQISSHQTLTFDFTRANVSIIFTFNQNNFDPNNLGILKTINPFVDLFGGKAPIGNSEDLDASLTSTDLQKYTDRVGEFYKFKEYVGTNPQDTFTTSSVYVRKLLSVDILSDFDSMILSNQITVASENSYPEHSRGWRIFELPTQEDLDNDSAYPLNLWVPVYGESLILSQVEEQIIDEFGLTIDVYTTPKDIVETGVEFISNALINKDGENMAPFTTSWGNWVPLTNKVSRKTVVTTFEYSMTIGIENEPNPIIDNVKLYLDGQIQPQSTYAMDGTNVIFDNGNKINQGSEIVVIYAMNEPSAGDLEFKPEIEDDITKQVAYKKDYPFTKVPVRDETGAISGFKYYFWVRNKTTLAVNKSQSINQVESQLEMKPLMFMTLQNILPEYSFNTTLPVEGVNLQLPIRYQTATVHGLDFYVRRNNAFKIRFEKNYTLRTDPNGLDLKNTHVEWTSIRPGMTSRLIPRKLWDKFVDSVCGENIDGIQIPSFERIDYDTRYNTMTRYGFAYDQILCDSETLLETIKYIMQNTEIVKIDKDGNAVPDPITVLDLTKIDSYFTDVETIRITMELLWNKATKRQVNELFFACLNDIVALNYEMTDLFKTSKLSVYSLRTINEIPQTGIVYDN